jgi:multidrug efflux system outer membrane protein
VATQDGQQVVQTTLISSVASDYFLLRQYDAQLVYSQDTVKVDREILDLNNIKFHGGESAITDVYQAQTLVEQSEAEVITLQEAIQQTENNISILLGRNPGPIARGLSLVDQPHLPEVPAGLPSALLRRRPDVRRDEENLVAANANVGVAKAAFFPQISLTGTVGQSAAITNFIQGPATFWSLGAQALQPIYEEQTHTYKQMADLANVRFQGGVTSFLEVQYYQQQYFLSVLNLEQAWYTELQNYVQLYQALGGGWEP